MSENESLCVVYFKMSDNIGSVLVKSETTEDECQTTEDECQTKLRSHVKRHVLAIHLPC